MLLSKSPSCNVVRTLGCSKCYDFKHFDMSIRTTEEISKWMKENDVSPSLVFHKAVEEMMGGNDGQ